MKKIKLSDISRNANIDMTYLSHLFSEISSFTFMEHLKYIRTNTALNLLLKSELPEIIRTHKSSAALLKQYIRDDDALSCYSEELRDKVTAEYLSGTRVTDIMSMYNLPRTTVYHWINDKKVLRLVSLSTGVFWRRTDTV